MKYCPLILLLILSYSTCTYPIVLFHGVNDNCEGSTQRLTSFVSSKLSVIAKCIEIGDGKGTSQWTSINHQGEIACNKIKQDPDFSGKNISVFGISQGGLIGRYIVQKCDFGGKVLRYVSLSSPQMGVAGVKFPACGLFCKILDFLIDDIAFFKVVQNNIAPSNYFKDRYDYSTYLQYSSFLADINNDRKEKNPQYKERITNLEKVLLITNENDDVVDPPTSGWFDFYAINSDQIESRRDSTFYKEDFIGIRQLEESGRITYARFNGTHTHFTDGELEEFVLPALR